MGLAGDRWPTNTDISKASQEFSSRCIEAYKVNPDLVEEHFAIEREIAEGGYGRRQIYELVQNGADEILRAGSGRKIAVVLSPTYLYCANEGTAIDRDGLRAILSAHRSAKRGNEIGRFGLGFKSVLAVTDAPEFFSRSGSFRFNPEQSRDRIRTVLPDVDRVPRLRLSFPVNAIAAAGEDDVLAELMEWATTVVRLPLAGEGMRSLPRDIEEFPSEFLLFSSHVEELILENRSAGYSRTITAERDGGSTNLIVADGTATTESQWTTFATTYKITEKARKTAGELADRDTLPLVWAVPTGTATARGRFWAFFPTQYWTTLRGILNAPWKTNADRQNLLESDFNTELIGVASDLVAAQLAHLQDPDDPGRHLDFLPGRGREAELWADKLLTEQVWERASRVASVPDLDGVLQLPDQVSVPPAGVTEQVMEIFSGIKGVERSWTHPSVLKRERRARIDRLIDEIDAVPATWCEFVGAAIKEGTAEASLAALQMGLEIDAEQPTPQSVARLFAEGTWRAGESLLTANGQWVQPDGSRVYLPGDRGADDAFLVVHPELCALPGAIATLSALGIGDLDSSAELEHRLSEHGEHDEVWWRATWELTRAVPVVDAVRLLSGSQHGRMRVRTVSGTLRPLSSVLLPGPIVPSDGSRDSGVCVDTDFHGSDTALLEKLGVASTFTLTNDKRQNERWYVDYTDEAFEAFLNGQGGSGRTPRQTSLAIDLASVLTQLDVVPLLSQEGRTAFVSVASDHERSLLPATLTHRGDRGYLPVSFPNPVWRTVIKHGWIETSLGVASIDEAVGPNLKAHGDLFAVTTVSDATAGQLGLAGSIEELDESHWRSAFERAVLRGPDLFGQALELAIEAETKPPTELPTNKDGKFVWIPANQVVVVTAPADSAVLTSEDRPHALVRDTAVAERLIEQWGLERGESIVETRPRPVRPESDGRADQKFPDLKVVLPEEYRNLEILLVDDLIVEERTDAGLQTRSERSYLDNQVLYVLRDEASNEEILSTINGLCGLGLSAPEYEAVLSSAGRAKAAGLAAAVRSAATIEARVLAAIGEPALRRSVPRLLLATVEDETHTASEQALEIARLSLAVHGVEILRKHQDDLLGRGLTPPPQWAGRDRERRWVSGLGFPVEFAGFPSENRDPVLAVPGPLTMPKLHDFQLDAVTAMRVLLKQRHGRGFLSLPTGAGKTRVATHAIVEAINVGEVKGPVLWIAQSDEICEQAVGTWSDTWRSMGGAMDLVLGRLWSKNDVDEVAGPQVVVATIDKLNIVREQSQYDWLSHAAVVVIDEGHKALAPEYTRVLDWLGLASGKERAPLFGLSATPFRGTSETETARLARRFGGERLDSLGDDPYRKLQDLGVLARVDHRLLQGGHTNLTVDELTRMRETRLLPSSVTDRLGDDEERNQRIVDAVLQLPDHFTVILFTTSVSNAELLAGVLSHSGVSAKPISGSTNAGARRHYVKQFKAGEIRVLTNYGVLVEGFDAPAVDAVFVTRPVLSPNVYQQMIGRGLRGPANGGKEQCLIVNVDDTFDLFGEQLAFHEFEYLWNRDAADG